MEAGLLEFLDGVKVSTPFQLDQYIPEPVLPARAHAVLGYVQRGAGQMGRAVRANCVGCIGIPPRQSLLAMNRSQHARNPERLAKASVVFTAEPVEKQFAPRPKIAVIGRNTVDVVVGHSRMHGNEKALRAEFAHHLQITQPRQIVLIGPQVLNGLRIVCSDERGFGSSIAGRVGVR